MQAEDWEGPHATAVPPLDHAILPRPYDEADDITSNTEHTAQDATQSESSPRKKVSPLVEKGKRHVAKSVKVMQVFEGIIVDIDHDHVWAELHDITCSKNPVEDIQFSVTKIHQSDRMLAQAGAIFYWVLGFETKSTGQIVNFSDIRMKRTPRWTRRTVSALRSRATTLLQQMSPR